MDGGAEGSAKPGEGKEHTLRVSFDTDQASLESVIDALNGTGCPVPGHRQLD
jgi:hypothetical protein